MKGREGNVKKGVEEKQKGEKEHEESEGVRQLALRANLGIFNIFFKK